MFDFLLDFVSIFKNAQKYWILAVPTLNNLTTRETNKTCQWKLTERILGLV